MYPCIYQWNHVQHSRCRFHRHSRPELLPNPKTLRHASIPLFTSCSKTAWNSRTKSSSNRSRSRSCPSSKISQSSGRSLLMRTEASTCFRTVPTRKWPSKAIVSSASFSKVSRPGPFGSPKLITKRLLMPPCTTSSSKKESRSHLRPTTTQNWWKNTGTPH